MWDAGGGKAARTTTRALSRALCACGLVATGWLLSMQALAADCTPVLARLVSLQGTIEVRRAQSTQWSPAAADAALCPGDAVRVGERSRAALRLTNESNLRLDQNSALTLPTPDEGIAFIELLRGALNVFTRTPSRSSVRTPFVNAGVEGTEFAVRVDADSAQVAVLEGKVSAANELGAVELTSGELAIAGRNAAPRRGRIVRPADAVQWALYYPSILGGPAAADAALREADALGTSRPHRRSVRAPRCGAGRRTQRAARRLPRRTAAEWSGASTRRRRRSRARSRSMPFERRARVAGHHRRRAERGRRSAAAGARGGRDRPAVGGRAPRAVVCRAGPLRYRGRAGERRAGERAGAGQRLGLGAGGRAAHVQRRSRRCARRRATRLHRRSRAGARADGARLCTPDAHRHRCRAAGLRPRDRARPGRPAAAAGPRPGAHPRRRAGGRPRGDRDRGQPGSAQFAGAQLPRQGVLRGEARTRWPASSSTSPRRSIRRIRRRGSTTRSASRARTGRWRRCAIWRSRSS